MDYLQPKLPAKHSSLGHIALEFLRIQKYSWHFTKKLRKVTEARLMAGVSLIGCSERPLLTTVKVKTRTYWIVQDAKDNELCGVCQGGQHPGVEQDQENCVSH